MPDFHHGIEQLRFYAGPKPIRTVSTAVIGLVGTAPIHLVEAQHRSINEPVLITSEEDAALKFGPDMPGYTIPAALRAIFRQGAGTVFVVNVFDPDRHVSGDSPLWGDHGVGNLPDPSLVTAADILANVDAAGCRTGLGVLQDCRSTYGFGPKQLICPVYAGLDGVASDLDAMAKKLRAFAWIDAPAGLIPAQAIEARGGDGTLNFASKDMGICYPHVKTTNAAGETVLMGMSAFIAGAQAGKDLTVGFHHSASNTVLQGVSGVERPIHSDPMDSACEANLLNAAGIITIYNDFGSGFRTWGNRSSSFPGSSDPDNFICVHRSASIIEDSIAAFSIQYIDRPITEGLIDQLLLDINAYLNSLIGMGASRDGAKAWYDAAKNPAQDVADGKLRICYKFLPPAPLEHLIYDSYLDISLAAGKA
jgi:phage tail sheath protein FI